MARKYPINSIPKFEQDIDDFFAFKPIRRRTPPPPADLKKIVPKKPVKVKTENPKDPRKFVGFDYVKRFQTVFKKDLSQEFSGLDITGLSSTTTFKNDYSFDDTALFDTSSNIDDELASKIANHKKDLPIFKYRDEIMQNIKNHPVIMISGPTGCGKSTQVPQYIYDSVINKETCNILISQPRKIAAVTLAQRVADERGVTLGSSVGYQVGLNKCINLNEESTQLTFCTTGVILQKLLNQKSLSRYSHIILDEVHERDLDIDFLMSILRRLNPLKTNTKIILMSATLDVEKFQEFWKLHTLELDDEFLYPPVIELDSRVRKYDILERYIDDIRTLDVPQEIIDEREPGISNEMYLFASNLILLILRLKSSENPSILIFLPGLPEIERLQEEFYNAEKVSKFRDYDHEIHILHSSLSVQEQKSVFLNTAKIKIILATNIAESSVTIPNVSFVIDFCLTKYLKNYRGSQMSSYVMAWASKNNCKQRAGRTGRLRGGVVFRLVFKQFYQQKMLEHSIPEMKLSPIESIIVKIKEFNMGSPLEMLANSIDPPDESSIVNAILILKEHGGMVMHDRNGNFQYHDGELTFLGKIMASLPCDIRMSKLIVLGYLFSVLDESIIIAAGLNFKGIFIHSLKNKMEFFTRKMKWSKGTGSDCIATYNAYTEWFERHNHNYFKSIDDERKWCRDNGLDIKILNEMRLWIQEITDRLKQFKIEKLPYPNQPMLSPKERILMMKTVMAGAFGVSNFFTISQHIDMERDAFNTLNNFDIFHAVYLRNMDRKIVGDVYKKQLKDTLIQKGVCNENSNVDIHFDRNSERVYISFDDDNLAENDDMGFGSGQIVPGVYKAVKLRKIEGSIKLDVLSAADTINYALEHGYGEYEQSEFRVHHPTLKYPEYWPYPTRSTTKMKGYITHIENCNKFYFCPLVAINTTHGISDERYKNALSNIKLYLEKHFATIPINSDKKIQPGELVIYKNQESNEIERAEFIKYIKDDFVEVYLMDVGRTIEVPLTYINILQNNKHTEKVKMYPPRVFECKLREIEPSCMESYGNKWSAKAVEYFRDGVLNKNETTIEIYSVVNDVVIVDLIIKTGDVETNWNKKLISAGYAQECEESFGSKLNHDKRVRDFYSFDKACDPKIEFARVIDKNYAKAHEIESPEKSKCINTISLLGPYSPLETNLRAASVDINGYVTVEANSINHILFNDEILSLYDKFYIAADVIMAARNNDVKVRETTAMPNIPGLAILMTLIFSPRAQLRRDKDKTRYTSVISGLGFDENYRKPYFYERDAIQLIDFELSEYDISDINSLRFFMSSMLYCDPFHKCPNINDRQREQTLKSIKEKFMAIVGKTRKIRDIQTTCDNFKWNTDQEDAIRHTNKFGHSAIWDYISRPPLNEMSREMKNQMSQHVKDLEDPMKNTFIKECKLCGVSFKSSNEISLHMLSKMHILLKNEFGIM